MTRRYSANNQFGVKYFSHLRKRRGYSAHDSRSVCLPTVALQRRLAARKGKLRGNDPATSVFPRRPLVREDVSAGIKQSRPSWFNTHASHLRASQSKTGCHLNKRRNARDITRDVALIARLIILSHFPLFFFFPPVLIKDRLDSRIDSAVPSTSRTYRRERALLLECPSNITVIGISGSR